MAQMRSNVPPSRLQATIDPSTEYMRANNSPIAYPVDSADP